MTEELEQKINAFEEQYAARLRAWAGFVDPEELEELVETIQTLDKVSNGITDQFQTRREKLYTDRWQPLLKDLMGLIPSIQNHVAAIINNTRQNMGVLGKGQRGLAGYRNVVPRKNSIFERDA